MYHIAIFDEFKMHRYSRLSEFNLCEHYCFDDKQLLNVIPNLHGVIIHYSVANQSKIFELILSISKRNKLPIWVKDNSNEDMNKTLNLELGAIGNIGEDASDEEVFKTVENTLNLMYGNEKEHEKRNKQTRIMLDSVNCYLQLPDDKGVYLTQLEFKLIGLLMSKPGTAFTYEEIYSKVWTHRNESRIEDKKFRIANMMHHIRVKLSKSGANHDFLKTIRSVGYLIDLYA